jgi:predicted  nucleic acid-binding Zn-ribbon protein
VVALLRFHLDKRAVRAASTQSEADAAEHVTNSAMMLLEPLTEELAKTRAEAARARAEAEKLRQDVVDLRAYVGLLMRVIDAAGLQLPAREKETP